MVDDLAAIATPFVATALRSSTIPPMVVEAMPRRSESRPSPEQNARFVAYVEALMPTRRVSNKNALGERLREEVGWGAPSTVSAWWNRGTIPGDDGIAALARFFGRPLDEVRAAAGKPVQGEPPETSSPLWLLEALAIADELTPAEQALLAQHTLDLARRLLELRASRSGEPHPRSDDAPPPPPHRRQGPR